MKCEYCDPEFYVVYGICPGCGIQTREPLPRLILDDENRFFNENNLRSLEKSQRKLNKLRETL